MATLEEVKRKVDEYFRDGSRPPEDTLAGLEDVAEQVEALSAAIREGLG